MVFWCVIRCDAPEIKSFKALFLSVKNGGNQNSDGAGKLTIIVIRGGLHIVTDAIVVKKQGSSDNFIGTFDLIVRELERGKRLRELGAEIVFREGIDAFFAG